MEPRAARVQRLCSRLVRHSGEVSSLRVVPPVWRQCDDINMVGRFSIVIWPRFHASGHASWLRNALRVHVQESRLLAFHYVHGLGCQCPSAFAGNCCRLVAEPSDMTGSRQIDSAAQGRHWHSLADLRRSVSGPRTTFSTPTKSG
jgi:hypothetical protein